MADHRRALLADAASLAADYLEQRVDRSVTPDAEAIAGLRGFDTPMPEASSSAADTLALLDRLGSPATMVTNGGRYFGFVTGGSLPATTAAGVLAAAWDQNGALPVMSPIAAQLDEVAARWIVDVLGLPPTSVAGFCGGASVANLTCLVAARDAVLAAVGWHVPADGLIGAPDVTVIAGAELHASMSKAIAIAGLGRDRTVLVPTDDQGRLRIDQVPAIDGPTIVVMQAGNVNTGASDRFDRVEEWRNAGAWVHVDGAFGLWARATPTRADQVMGIEHASSWATDAHKWLNVPYDAGVTIVADGNDLARSMRTDAAYLVVDPLGGPGRRLPMQLGIQMSQQARGILVWAALHSLGRSGVAALVERSCGLADRFASKLVAAGATVPHEVVLNQVLVSFGDDETTDALIGALAAEGTIWAGGTTWHDRRHLRLSVSGHDTTEADVDAGVDAILRCWDRL